MAVHANGYADLLLPRTRGIRALCGLLTWRSARVGRSRWGSVSLYLCGDWNRSDCDSVFELYIRLHDPLGYREVSHAALQYLHMHSTS